MNTIFGVYLLTYIKGVYQGRYLNNVLTSFATEDVAAIASSADFEGTFTSNWKEGVITYTADLRITNNGGLFQLNWENIRKDGVDQNVTFSGIGAVEAGRLCCYYTMNR